MIKRSFFTLLELMLVIAVLSIVAGFGAINIRLAIIQQGFFSDVGLVVDQLRLAQNLMLMFNADSYVKFEGGKEGMKMWVETDAIVSKNWQRELNREPRMLTSIHSIHFPEVEDGQVIIRFLSGGSVMSRGMLQLSAEEKRGNLVRVICLPGYPTPIKSEIQTASACELEDETRFLETLTEITQREITESFLIEPIEEEPEEDEGEDEENE